MFKEGFGNGVQLPMMIRKQLAYPFMLYIDDVLYFCVQSFGDLFAVISLFCKLPA